ncbi:PadR family transcriptional regulator [bacterium]|nr:PadR family transcriptional regulator [bacterium]
MQFSKELLKGTAEIIVLQALKAHGAQYGYQLIQTIAQSSDNVFELQEGTLYPILYRLEDRGYVTSDEREAPSGKTRRYYTITQNGVKQLKEKTKEIGAFVRGVTHALRLA